MSKDELISELLRLWDDTDAAIERSTKWENNAVFWYSHPELEELWEGLAKRRHELEKLWKDKG